MAVFLMELFELIRRAWQRTCQGRRSCGQEENDTGEMHISKNECGWARSLTRGRDEEAVEDDEVRNPRCRRDIHSPTRPYVVLTDRSYSTLERCDI
jgi:hypothetical protein